MTGHVPGGILRAASRIASTLGPVGRGFFVASAIVAAILSAMAEEAGLTERKPTAAATGLRGNANQQAGPETGVYGLPQTTYPSTNQAATAGEVTHQQSVAWDFSRTSDENFDSWPDGWQRYRGTGYPSYVEVAIVPVDPDLERRLLALDAGVMRFWPKLRSSYPSLPPLPPSISDMVVDRYLRIDLDGGQVKLQSPGIAASRMYQYRFSCRMMTQGLRHDSARAELVFLDKDAEVLAVHPTASMRGTNKWTPQTLQRMRPPPGATEMLVRLVVERSEDGLEDIRGAIGFDDIRIEQYPQLRITTDETLGIYAYGRPITATARIMGLSKGASRIRFELFDSRDQKVMSRSLATKQLPTSADQPASDSVDYEVSWKLPRLDPGYYRVTASLVGSNASSLATETTIAVIDKIIGGGPHGSFGWTLPQGNRGIPPRELASWLADLGVAWVKYPCWLAPDDTLGAEEVATVFSKLQDAGIQTVGMLDLPPEEQLSVYALRSRREVVAHQLFRDIETWQPRLEPVMTRLTLKVRKWQLGADRDHSFLGRPRLRESIRQISTGLQGFGQPIDIAISWPWMERQLPHGESSWQAICRSSDPALGASELDSFLALSQQGVRGDGPRTWLLLDPVPKSKYDRQSRIRDLVLRMATVRSHRVQAAFVSHPRDPQQGLLRPDGRPDELLLPWRTTSRLIGNLRKVGSLKLRSGAENLVFAGDDRAVLMLWSAQPTEEQIYLGDHIQAVDVWGKVTNLPVEPIASRGVQRIKIGPVPTFIIGADPTLLAFRMSVDVEQEQLDSFLGQIQKLTVSFANPTRESMVGQMRLLAPDTWAVDAPARPWEALAGRSATHSFDVVLSNTAKIGKYELPIQFEIETTAPKQITVYRNVSVGPYGLDLNVTTRLLRGGELRVQIELANRSQRVQSYDCMLFPPPGRQYQRRFITIKPGETVRREIYWPRGDELIGQRMLLRAVEQDGRRVLNYAIDVSR